MAKADIVILGGGAAGLSTAFHLAASGDAGRVCLIERNSQLAAESSALNAAILRTLDSDALTSHIALRSAAFLRQPPPGFSEVPLVDERGLILWAEKGGERALAGQVEAVGAGMREEAVDRGRLRALHPLFEPDGDLGFYFADEGQIDIAALMAGFARGARRGGVAFRQGERRAMPWVERGRARGVLLEGGDRIEADRVVIAAGGWAGALGRAAGSRVRLRPTRRHLLVTRPSADVDPRWPVAWQLGADGFYARPESGGMLLCGCDLTDADPDAFSRDATIRELIARKAARHLPELMHAGVGHYWCGLRTLSADGRFVVGEDGDIEGLYWVAGLAGAGMVCSAEVGRMAARLLLGRAIDPREKAALSPARKAVTG